jgi:hypothetical protein
VPSGVWAAFLSSRCRFGALLGFLTALAAAIELSLPGRLPLLGMTSGH